MEEVKAKPKKVLTGIQRTECRAEFKLNVSNFAAKRMEPHRKQLFVNDDAFGKLLRKVCYYFITKKIFKKNLESRLYSNFYFIQSYRLNNLTKKILDNAQSPRQSRKMR